MSERECFLCGEKGHFKAQCPQRWYVPKVQWSNWWSTLPFQKGKGKGRGQKGKGEGEGKGQGNGGMASVEQQWQDDSQWWGDDQWGNDVQWMSLGSMSKKVQKISPHAAPRLWGALVACPRVDAATKKAGAQSGNSIATAAPAVAPAAAATAVHQKRHIPLIEGRAIEKFSQSVRSNRFAVLTDDREYEAETSADVDIQELIKTKPEKKMRGRKPRKCNVVDAKIRHVIEIKDEDEIDDIIKEMQEQQAEASASAKNDEIVPSSLHTLTKTSANNTSRPWECPCDTPRRADWQPSSSDWEREGILRANGSQVSEQLSLETDMVKKLGRMIAGLSIKKESLSPCIKKETEWTKLSLVVDSGACESVIDAAEQLPGYPIMETKASRSGRTYASATGEDILNLGEVRVPMIIEREH